MPWTAASRYRSGFSDSSLCVASVPSGRRATISVNVPPRSIQNCHCVITYFFRFMRCHIPGECDEHYAGRKLTLLP